MMQAEGSGVERRVRRWRSVCRDRPIVELTLEPGASVALVARAHGVNANLVFKWRRAFERGEMSEPVAASTALLPATMSAPRMTRDVVGRCWNTRLVLGAGRVLEADSRAAQTTEPAFRVSRISKEWTCSIQGIVSYRGWSSPLNVQGKAGSYFDMSRQHYHCTERGFRS